MTHLTSRRPDPRLELAAYVGQRAATFRFDLVDAVTGYREPIHPVADSPPTLTHNTRNTVKRSITGLELTRADTLKFNSITSRLEPFMIVRGVEYPLGRYVPASQVRQRYTSGVTSVAGWFDEGIIVDQQFDSSFGPQAPFTTESVVSMLNRLLSPLPVDYYLEPSPYVSAGSWSIGTRRGAAVESLAFDGDYLSPWFDNASIMQFKRSFDPATELPAFDLDEPGRVLRDRILETDDLTELPNRYIVIGNGTGVVGTTSQVVGVADVPSSAPHSILNRGFVIPDTQTRQVTSQAQAQAQARSLALHRTAVEQVELLTPPDPRHDSYDVIRWRGVNWLEVSWSLPMREGAAMSHVAHRAYTP